MMKIEIITNILTKVEICEYLGLSQDFSLILKKKIDIFFFKILKKCEIFENWGKIFTKLEIIKNDKKLI